LQSIFRQKSTYGGAQQAFNTSAVTGHRTCSFCQMCDLHFKFEEDRTKIAVAIESDRYSFGQTDTSRDFILCVQCHELHWTDNNTYDLRSCILAVDKTAQILYDTVQISILIDTLYRSFSRRFSQSII